VILSVVRAICVVRARGICIFFVLKEFQKEYKSEFVRRGERNRRREVV
jgi:hypothetical protein